MALKLCFPVDPIQQTEKNNRTSKHKIWVISMGKYSLWVEEATVVVHASLGYCNQPSAAVERAPQRRILSA